MLESREFDGQFISGNTVDKPFKAARFYECKLQECARLQLRPPSFSGLDTLFPWGAKFISFLHAWCVGAFAAHPAVDTTRDVRHVPWRRSFRSGTS